jgi:serine/threonine protein kinase
MRMNPFMMRQFEVDPNAIVAMDHPGIVRCVDSRMAQGRPYLVMDLIEGVVLSDYLAACSSRGLLLQLHVVARIISSIARGVDHAHSRGVLHLEIKPGNIVL